VKMQTFLDGLAIALAVRQGDREGAEMLLNVPCDERRAREDIVLMFSRGTPCADLPDWMLRRAILDWAS
jgi:hypothetical protein